MICIVYSRAEEHQRLNLKLIFLLWNNSDIKIIIESHITDSIVNFLFNCIHWFSFLPEVHVFSFNILSFVTIFLFGVHFCVLLQETFFYLEAKESFSLSLSLFFFFFLKNLKFTFYIMYFTPKEIYLYLCCNEEILFFSSQGVTDFPSPCIEWHLWKTNVLKKIKEMALSKKTKTIERN